MADLAEIVSLLDSTLYNSLGFILVTLGILVSIRFMGFPDLTVDGSFTLGAAAYAVGVASGLSVILCLVLAALAGMTAGTLTATANRALRISQIVSSILVMLSLITAVPYLTGGTTIGLLRAKHGLAQLHSWDLSLTRSIFPNSDFSLHPSLLFTLAGLCTAILLVLSHFFRTRLGVQMRYLGSARAPHLLHAGQRFWLLYLGLALGNALVAVGGAIEAERHGGFNQNMGTGVILIGLASLVLGESAVKTFVRRDNLHVREYLFAAVVGVITYSLVLQLLLLVGLTFLDVRLTTSLFLLVLLTIAARRHPNTARLF